LKTLSLPSLALTILGALSAPPAMSQTADALYYSVSQDQVLRSVKGSAQPSMLVFGESIRSSSGQFSFQPDVQRFSNVRKLLQGDDLADLGISPINVSMRETSQLLRERFGLAASVKWAIIDSNEQCLASGQDLPAAKELAEILAAKGVRSPVRVLREFLKTRPDHLDARNELLKLQRRDADRRTKDALDIKEENGPPSQTPGTVVLSSGARSFSGSISVSTQGGPGGSSVLGMGQQEAAPVPKDKVLDTKEDLQIWAGFADSFDRLVTGDDWIAAGLEFNMGDMATEACSPSVKGLFKRKMAQVEAALERAPASPKLWSVWVRMADVIGGKSIISVADRLVLQPGKDMTSLPRFVRDKLLVEARATNNWPYIAENLWGQYEAEKANPIPNPTISGMASDDARLRDIIGQFMENTWTQRWDSLYEPLLEALLHTNDVGRADSIMNTMREWLTNGQWSVNQMQKAIGLANRCNKPEVAKRWSDLIADYAGK